MKDARLWPGSAHRAASVQVGMVFPQLPVRNDLILLCLHLWDVLISIPIHLEGSARGCQRDANYY